MSESKYKVDRSGIPDWVEIGVLVEAWDDPDHKVRGRIVGFNCGAFRPFILENDRVWSLAFQYAEPAPAWQPSPGEYVAAWDDGSGFAGFYIAKYTTEDASGGYFVDGEAFQHIARITNPSIDIACSVDELKERTDWL